MASRYLVLMVTDSRAGDIINYSEEWGDIKLDVVYVPVIGLKLLLKR